MSQPVNEHTAVTIIVIRPSVQALAEQAAIAADPEGGAGTFAQGVPLRAAGDATAAVAAYWARWNMKPGQRAAFASAMGGPNNILAPGARVPTNRDRWFFDATEPGGWTAEQVLAALSLDRMPPEEY